VGHVAKIVTDCVQVNTVIARFVVPLATPSVACVCPGIAGVIIVELLLRWFAQDSRVGEGVIRALGGSMAGLACSGS